GLASADSRAIVNLRAALNREPAELERLYPRTAAEPFSRGKSWLETCPDALAGLDVDPDRVREVAALIPGAMRGLVSERQLGSYADLDLARRGLTNALAAYLEGSRTQCPLPGQVLRSRAPTSGFGKPSRPISQMSHRCTTRFGDGHGP